MEIAKTEVAKGQAWHEQVKSAFEREISPELLAKTHAGLLKSRNEMVRLNAVKEAYRVGGVGDAPLSPLPMIVLGLSLSTPRADLLGYGVTTSDAAATEGL